MSQRKLTPLEQEQVERVEREYAERRACDARIAALAERLLASRAEDHLYHDTPTTVELAHESRREFDADAAADAAELRAIDEDDR